MVTNNTESNWDKHYKNHIRRILLRLGLKGNILLNHEVAKFIIKKTQGFDSFIEIGAGGGLLTKLMTKKFKECVVLDKSKSALKVSSSRAKKSTSILCDIFEFYANEKFDAVASLGLAEHFKDEDMERLIFIHIEIAKPDGCVFLLVPAYNKRREKVVVIPSMKRKYGYQDAFAEYKIENFLKRKNIAYEKIYFGKIPHYIWYYNILSKIALLIFLIFRINLENNVSRKKGNYVLFYIKKNFN